MVKARALCRTRNSVFRLRNKSWTNHFTKTYFKKIENFPEKINVRKQLERFLRCLTYASDFIRDLVNLRKPLRQKFKKKVSWTCTSIDTKIIQNLKKMCKNLPIINLPNEEDDWILEIDANNEHWSAVLKIKKGEKLYKYCSGTFIVIRGIEKFLIFLAQNLFLFELIAKEY